MSEESKKYKNGIVCGAFDVIHPGYIHMFRDAKSVCDNLIILLQTDPTIDRPEKMKPTQTVEDRELILRSIRYVDDVKCYTTEKDLYNILKQDFYDVRILGSDYIDKNFTGRDLKREIYWHDRSHGYSATKFKNKIMESLK
jgi:glycerol-3-phosphate cytidylyltransferase